MPLSVSISSLFPWAASGNSAHDMSDFQVGDEGGRGSAAYRRGLGGAEPHPCEGEGAGDGALGETAQALQDDC